FELKIKLNGQGSFSVEPVGRVTKLSLSSDWPSPGFSGAFLPDSHQISKDGFTAEWQVLDLNRNYPQQWSDDEYNGFGGQGRMAFGVRLVQPVDEYLKNTRSAKYAVLVVGLTFLIFFFFEVLHKLLIHPFQYFLIGIALAVFYLILLSFSEHIGFNRAYLVATAATVSLISGYGWAILKYKKLVLQLTLFLVTIYGFIYIILQLEDYALLAGTVGVFVALALAMYYSRNIDWYNLGDSEVSEN
ncbi:MAG: cell envelope integrity protein CreD, partial [Bacteroidetes bacterium]